MKLNWISKYAAIATLGFCFATSCFVTQAVNAQQTEKQIRPLVVWDELGESIRPVVSGTGQYVVSSNPYLIVREVVNGLPGKIVWYSQKAFAEYLPVGHSWFKNMLLMSRVKQSIGAGTNALYETSGNTITVNVSNGEVTNLLPKAYRYVLASPQGQCIAGILPTGKPSPDSVIDFYSFDPSKNTCQLTASYANPRWTIGDNLPQLLCWSRDEKGVFVTVDTSYFDKDDNEEIEKPSLFYISTQGKVTEVLPERVWIESYPSPQAIRDNTIFSLISYFGATPFVATLAPAAILQSTLWREVRDIVRNPKMSLREQNPQIIALAPNGRIVIIQDMGPDQNVDYTRLRQVWAVDLTTKKRRAVGKVEQLNALSWCMYGLLCTLFTEQHGDESISGVLKCPEALMAADSAELNRIISSNAWEQKLGVIPI